MAREFPMRPDVATFEAEAAEHDALLASTAVRVLYGSHRPILVPLVSQHCMFCDQLVDLCEKDSFGLTRVNGDSRYGYEAYHEVCMEQETALQEAHFDHEQALDAGVLGPGCTCGWAPADACPNDEHALAGS